MIHIKLNSIDYFDDLNLPSDEEVLLNLRELYPNEYKSALSEFKETHKYIFADELSELIELVDTYIDDEILINFFVRDSVGTDKGTHNFISANAYIIKNSN